MAAGSLTSVHVKVPTPRRPPHQLLAAGDEPYVRTAVAGREPKLLALPDCDIRTVLAWRCEDGEADRIDAGDGERSGGVRLLGQTSSIDQEAEEVGLLEDQRRRLCRGLLTPPDLHAATFAEGAEHLEVLRMQVT